MGNKAEPPKYPFRLKFVAGEAVAGEGVPRTNGDSRFYKQLVERGNAQIDKDVILYHVHATDGPAEESDDSAWFEIG